jgi:hypothetical protein
MAMTALILGHIQDGETPTQDGETPTVDNNAATFEHVL